MSTFRENMDHEMRPLEVVELTVDSGRWAAGTVGTVVESRGDLALVEIADDRGHSLDFVSLPAQALHVLPAHRQGHLAI